MVNGKNIVLNNINFEQFEKRMYKIGKDFKDYKKEWEIEVRKSDKVFYITARSKKRIIMGDGGGRDEIAKYMKIIVFEDVEKLRLEFKYSYRFDHFVLIKLIPWTIYLLDSIFLFNIIYQNLFGNEMNIQYGYGFVLLILTMTIIFCFWGSEKLEKERLKIIEELLNRFVLYNF